MVLISRAEIKGKSRQNQDYIRRLANVDWIVDHSACASQLRSNFLAFSSALFVPQPQPQPAPFAWTLSAMSCPRELEKKENARFLTALKQNGAALKEYSKIRSKQLKAQFRKSWVSSNHDSTSSRCIVFDACVFGLFDLALAQAVHNKPCVMHRGLQEEALREPTAPTSRGRWHRLRRSCRRST